MRAAAAADNDGRRWQRMTFERMGGWWNRERRVQRQVKLAADSDILAIF
jgi:hypothetical protein